MIEDPQEFTDLNAGRICCEAPFPPSPCGLELVPTKVVATGSDTFLEGCRAVVGHGSSIAV
jgi:hypothetical protein